MTREIVLKALYGSQNYGCALPTSDRDYKIYVLPTPDDIMKTGFYVQEEKTKEGLNVYYDIRYLPSHLFKSNINFTEILFSCDLFYIPQLEFLITNREKIAKINPPYLYNSVLGTIYNKKKKFDKERNVKELMHILRLYYFLSDYMHFLKEQHPTPFEISLPYRAQEMLNIRQGLIPWEDVLRKIEEHEKNQELVKSFYMQFLPDTSLLEQIKELVKKIIIENLIKK